MNDKQNQTIPAFLLKCRRKYSRKPAIALLNGNYLSYNDLLWDIARTSQILREQGISQGSKVALFVENTPQALESFLAVLNMGAIAIPLRCDLSAEHVAAVLSAEQPGVIFAGKDTVNLIPADMQISIVSIDTNEVFRDCGKSAASFISDIKESDPAVIVYQESPAGTLRRRIYTHKEMAREAACIKRPVKVPQMPFDTLIDYARSFIMPVLNGVCIYCHDILHSLSAMQTSVRR